MRDRVTVIGVAWSGSNDDFRAFEEKHGLTFPSISDPAGDVYGRFSVPYQPAWVYMDTDGTTRVHTGALDESSALAELAALADG